MTFWFGSKSAAGFGFSGSIIVKSVLLGLGLGVPSGPMQAAEAVDTYPDTWTATDSLGRTTPGHGEAGSPRSDRFVGIFYFLWLGQHHTEGPYNISQILAAHPDAMKRPTTNPWGPEYRFHHWAEPLFGYYKSDDAWVLRKHAQMLSDAGVDVAIFDVSNQQTYPRVYNKLCEVWKQVRRDGGRTPQIAFFGSFGDDRQILARLYDDLYKPRHHEELWFHWKGKPLILAKRDHAPAPMRETFTFREHGPDYFSPPSGPNQWQWLQIYPQQPYYSVPGKNEEVSVSVGQNASGKRLCAFSEENTYGRSWHDGARDTRPDAVLHGFNFAEQWTRALELDPEFVYITGWNEWIALRLPEFWGVRKPVMFVDQFTQEYSRDIEPMKGGHWDNYYYQMIGNIRRFKGVRPPPPPSEPTTIEIDGGFADWAGVSFEYHDDRGDTMHRDSPAYDGPGRYVNKSGRNDFVLLKTAADGHAVYFYARTAAPITPHTDPRWMLLFIDADGNPKTGWEGYDFRINRRVRRPTETTVEKAVAAKTWKRAGTAPYRITGNELELAVPRRLLGLPATGPIRIGFKWADHILEDDDVMEFTVNGDTAPNARFQYVFTTR